MLRVLTLTSRFPSAAQPYSGNFVLRQTIALAERPGVEVQVVAPVTRPAASQDAGGEAGFSRGIRVHRPRLSVPPDRAATSRDWEKTLLPALRDIRVDFPFDLLHAEFFWPEGPAAWRLAEEFRVPLSIKARGEDLVACSRDAAAMAQLAGGARAGAAFLAISGEIRTDMIALGLSPDRIRVHYPGVDRALFGVRSRAAAKEALRVEGSLLLIVGNLIGRKRQALALDALALIDGATLLIAGGGPDLPMLKERARILGIDHRVRFLGLVPHELLPHLYAAADATLVPSRAEGLANVRLESLACGTPIVTTDVGGAREVVRTRLAGRVVADDPASIANAVREIVADPPDQDAVARSVARFSWERNARELESHMRKLVRMARARPDPVASIGERS